MRVPVIRHQHVAFGNELLDLGVGHTSLSEMVDVDVVPFETYDGVVCQLISLTVYSVNAV